MKASVNNIICKFSIPHLIDYVEIKKIIIDQNNEGEFLEVIWSSAIT